MAKRKPSASSRGFPKSYSPGLGDDLSAPGEPKDIRSDLRSAELVGGRADRPSRRRLALLLAGAVAALGLFAAADVAYGHRRDQPAHQGFTRLGRIASIDVWGKVGRDGSDKTLWLRTTGAHGDLCNSTGPYEAASLGSPFVLCEASQSGVTFVAFADPPGQLHTVSVDGIELKTRVLGPPRGGQWPVTVAFTGAGTALSELTVTRT